MSPQVAAGEFALNALRNEPGLPELLEGGIHPDQAPDGTLTDYIVLSPIPMPDELTNDREFCMATVDYQARAIFAGNTSAPDVVEDLILSALHDKHVTQNGYRIDCVRFAPLSDIANQSGRTYRFAGARFRVVVRPAELYS